MSYIDQRREEEKERRRAEILDAAEALTEIGWEAATMDEVARRARLSRALVYVYFKDKRDLHFAIVERALRELRKRFEQAASEPTGIDKVEAIGRAYVTFSRDVPHYFDACSQFQAHRPRSRGGDSNESAALHAGQRVHEVLVAALDDGDRGRHRSARMSAIRSRRQSRCGVSRTASSRSRRARARTSALGVGAPALVEQRFRCCARQWQTAVMVHFFARKLTRV